MFNSIDFQKTQNSKSVVLSDSTSFKQLLAFRAETSADKKIVFWNDKSYTWKDIDCLSQIIAADLFKIGVRKGCHVAIMSKNSVNWIATFYAVQKLGALAVLLNFSLVPEEVKVYAEVGDIKYLCYGDISSKLEKNTFISEIMKNTIIEKVYNMSSGIDFRMRYDELPQLKGLCTENYNSDDASYIILTSGSTGKPKACLSSAYNLIGVIENLATESLMNENDCICIFLSFFHIFGFSTGIVHSLMLNIPLCLPKSNSDADIIETISKYHCTLFNSVPTKIISMVRSEYFTPEKLLSLRCSMIGGAAISEAQLRELQKKLPQVHLMPIYGMSEVPIISFPKYTDTTEHLLSTVGKPSEQVQVEIRDSVTGEVCPNGVEGEINVRSVFGMTCYYKLKIDKQPMDGNGWIRTGDLGILTEDGYLKISGRIKDLIIRGGENIAPKEIESVITGIDTIYDVKVVGVPDELYGEIVVAAIVMNSCAVFNRSLIEASIKPKIAIFKMPTHYVLYDSFPLLENGKIDMVALKNDVIKRVQNGQCF